MLKYWHACAAASIALTLGLPPAHLTAAPLSGGPAPPCGSFDPPYPPAGMPDVVAWTSKQLPADWQPPSCVQWASSRFSPLVAVAATFRQSGSTDNLLKRIGAVSNMRGLPYWSVTDHRIEPLIMDAHAVEGPESNQPRSDFAPDEMKSGRPLFFVQHDDRSSNYVLYRMRVTAINPNSVTIDVENAGKIRLLILDIFDSGDLHTTFIFKRISRDEWGYYSLSGAHQRPVVALTSHQQSYINRSLALFAYMAGVSNMDELPWAK